MTKKQSKKSKGSTKAVFYTNSLGTFKLVSGKLHDAKGKQVSSKQLRDKGGPLNKSDAEGNLARKERGIIDVKSNSPKVSKDG